MGNGTAAGAGDAPRPWCHAADRTGSYNASVRAFYRRTRAWVDAEVADASRVDETVSRWSPRFFEILKSTTAEENARLSQTGELVLRVQGRVLRVVES